MSDIVPRPGESGTDAIFRLYDRFHGTGLTDTDQTVIVCNDHAADQCTVSELRDALTLANGQIECLQQRLADPLTGPDDRADGQLMMAHLARAIAEVDHAIAQRSQP
jgi:predicted short-subunit dehydrogenase-like oxidoreductase (DUF2520 family)